MDTGLLALPLLSLLAVFGFAVVTDVNMITFEVASVPKVLQDAGFSAGSVRGSITYGIYNISKKAETSRGVTYSTVANMQVRSLQNISESLRIEGGVLAAQSFLGLIPYQFKAKIVQEGDVLYLIINGFSRDNGAFSMVLKSDTLVASSSQSVTGHTNLPLGIGNAEIVTRNVGVAVKDLLARAAEAIIDRIDPYLLARYYFVEEVHSRNFTKTMTQLMRCLEILPRNQQIWPLLLWGRIHYYKGEYTEAIAIYEQISKVVPTFPFAPLRWGEVLAAQGLHEQAIEKYKLAIKDNSLYHPGYPVAKSLAYALWAKSLIAMQQIDQVEVVLMEGLDKVYEGNASATAGAIIHYALGRFLLDYKADYNDAEYHLRQAVYMDDNPEYYRSLQDVLAKTMPSYAKYLQQTRGNRTKDHSKEAVFD
ncbi:hypothetical protein TI04_03530 [Achromatium sp. WMS2]|nr:hypothetical protein TI04_03530 [Achromatium sp. WMS2]